MNPENRVLQRDTVRAATRLQPLARRLTLEGSVDYDLLAKNLVQATALLRYRVQCCGLVAQVIQSDYNAKQGLEYHFAIELANIGSIGNFMGTDTSAGFLGRR